MLTAPGQPVHVRTQGLYGWERVGRSVGEGLSSALKEGWKLARLERKVNSAGELAAFSEQLKGISAEVRDELANEDVQDWNYSWNAAIAPRIHDAVQGLSADSREAALELARAYSAQSSIEARRDRDMQRVSTARERWEQQVDSSISAGKEEHAARWLEAGRGVFVPEGEMEKRLSEVRSRACHSRWEARLQASPMETLSAIAAARKEDGQLPVRAEERQRLEESCARARQSLRRGLATEFSDRLRAGEEVEASARELAVQAGILPEGAGGKRVPAEEESKPSAVTLSLWRRWLDSREEGEQSEIDARLAIALAPLPLEERRSLLMRLERMASVSAADRRALSNHLFALYNAGALGCPGDAEAQRALLALQDEGATLLAEQGAEAVSAWVKARREGADNWVCFEEAEPRRRK